MIRPDDRYVSLDDRYQNARKLGADLFVSIHADAFSLSSVKGASVYVWSEEASSITADDTYGSCDPCIRGCMDPTANNYDSLAAVDNGTCEYDVTFVVDMN